MNNCKFKRLDYSINKLFNIWSLLGSVLLICDIIIMSDK